MLNYTLAFGDSVKSNSVKHVQYSWKEICDLFGQAEKTKETLAEYASLTVDQKTEVKNSRGYYIAGKFKKNVRNSKSLLHRGILTLDADYAPAHYDLANLQQKLKTNFLAHTTHSSTPDKVKFRLLLPLSRCVNDLEYEFLVRFVAAKIDAAWFDRAGFRYCQAMFFPTCPADSEYQCIAVTDREMLDVDKILNGWGYDLEDMSHWPCTDSDSIYHRDNKVQNPLEKIGIVGAFCRAYSIHEAIDTFLEDVYKKTDMENRYTYIKGTSSKGAIVYDDLYLYSHHGTDPCYGHLVNAFDLVRIHRFGNLDAESKAQTPHNRLPSYLEMVKWASDHEPVKRQFLKDKIFEANKDFDIAESPTEHTALNVNNEEDEWLSGLQISDKGAIKPSFLNACLIIEHDPNLKGAFRYNEFTNTVYVFKSIGRDVVNSPREIRNITDLAVRTYIDSKYQLEINPNKITDAINHTARKNPFHPVRDYLKGLSWDGLERVERLFIEYVGAEDNVYTREVAEKFMVAAVARVFEPGVKFDNMPILEGRQGIRKSSLWRALSKGWFSELTTFDDKKAVEIMQGVWILEAPELAAFARYEIEKIKQFISAQDDRVRMAYERRAETFLRQCVFAGSTNNSEYLKDNTGNRRFWPIACHVAQINIDKLKQNIDQLWAEAHVKYMLGTDLYLSPEAEAIARQEQKGRMVYDELEGIIKHWLNTLADPHRYDDAYSEFNSAGASVERDRVCVMEIWEDCLGKSKSSLERRESMRINAILESLPEWEKKQSIKFGKRFGIQRGFIRKTVI